MHSARLTNAHAVSALFACSITWHSITDVCVGAWLRVLSTSGDADRRARFGAGFGAWRLALTRFGAWPLALLSSAFVATAAVPGGGGAAHSGANDRRNAMPCPMVTKATRPTKSNMCEANRLYRSLLSIFSDAFVTRS